MNTEKETKHIGLSRELIIHPGETLDEIITDRGISQRELSIRTGMTEKHISTVINGLKGISPAFAYRLEYALGIESSFWMNLQNAYDRQLQEYEEIGHLSDEELELAEFFKERVDLGKSPRYGTAIWNPSVQVFELRKFLGVNRLQDIPSLTVLLVGRTMRDLEGYNPYLLYLWITICEKETEDIFIGNSFDTVKLRRMLPMIKNVMFTRQDQIINKLTALLAECGIVFKRIKGYSDIDVKGYIRERPDGSLILCINSRCSYQDVFWYDLFEAISYILVEDIKKKVICLVSREEQTRSQRLACDYLVAMKDYKVFIESSEYKEPSAVDKYAKTHNVRPYIIMRKLADDGMADWSERPEYKWAE